MRRNKGIKKKYKLGIILLLTVISIISVTLIVNANSATLLNSRVLTTDSTYSTSSYVDIVIDLNGGSATWFGGSSYTDCFNGPYVFLYDFKNKSLSDFANLTILWNYNTDSLVLSNGGGRGVHYKTKGTLYYFSQRKNNVYNDYYSLANPQSKIIGTSVSGSKITIQYRFDVQGSTPYMILPQVTKYGYNHTGWTVKTDAKWYAYEYNEDTGATREKASGNVGNKSTITMKDSSGNTWYLLHMGQTSRYDTVTANYTPWTHTVSYNANGGSGVPSNQTKTYGTNLTLSSTKPTREGYEFIGWNTNADGTGTSYNTGSTYTKDQNGGTVTLYAQWKCLDEDAPTITIDMQEGWLSTDSDVLITTEDLKSGIAKVTVTEGSTVIFEKNYNGEKTVTNTLTFTVEQNTTYTVTATDLEGNTSTKPFTVKIDKTAPDISDILSSYGWTNGNVTINPSASDLLSGIAYFKLCTSSADILYISGTTSLEYTFRTEGENTYIIEARDKAGNTTTYSFKVKIDKTAPDISEVEEIYEWTCKKVRLKPKGTDALTNVQSIELYDENSILLASGTDNFYYEYKKEGISHLTLKATDIAGNVAITNITVKQDFTVPEVFNGTDVANDDMNAKNNGYFYSRNHQMLFKSFIKDQTDLSGIMTAYIWNPNGDLVFLYDNRVQDVDARYDEVMVHYDLTTSPTRSFKGLYFTMEVYDYAGNVFKKKIMFADTFNKSWVRIIIY